MKIIELTRGKQAIVDDDDYVFLSQWKWRARKALSGLWYAVRHQNGAIFMHHALLEVESPNEIDHRNGNGLDNRRENLRPCTRAQNQQNRRGWMRSDSKRSSRFKGVSFEIRPGRKPLCLARIVINGTVQKKRFSEHAEEQAACWYDQMARQHFGEFARCNFG